MFPEKSLSCPLYESLLTVHHAKPLPVFAFLDPLILFTQLLLTMTQEKSQGL